MPRSSGGGSGYTEEPTNPVNTGFNIWSFIRDFSDEQAEKAYDWISSKKKEPEPEPGIQTEQPLTPGPSEEEPQEEAAPEVKPEPVKPEPEPELFPTDYSDEKGQGGNVIPGIEFKPEPVDKSFLKNVEREPEQDESEFYTKPKTSGYDRAEENAPKPNSGAYNEMLFPVDYGGTTIPGINTPRTPVTQDQFLGAANNLLNPLMNFGVKPAEGATLYDLDAGTVDYNYNPEADFRRSNGYADTSYLRENPGNPFTPAPANPNYSDPMAYWLNRQYPEYTGGDYNSGNRDPNWRSKMFGNSEPKPETPAEPEIPPTYENYYDMVYQRALQDGATTAEADYIAKEGANQWLDYDATVKPRTANDIITELQKASDVMTDLNPSNNPLLTYLVTGKKPSEIARENVEQASNLLEQGGDLFRRGFDTVGNIGGMVLDNAPGAINTGLDYATENALKPLLESGAGLVSDYLGIENPLATPVHSMGAGDAEAPGGSNSYTPPSTMTPQKEFQMENILHSMGAGDVEAPTGNYTPNPMADLISGIRSKGGAVGGSADEGRQYPEYTGNRNNPFFYQGREVNTSIPLNAVGSAFYNSLPDNLSPQKRLDTADKFSDIYGNLPADWTEKKKLDYIRGMFDSDYNFKWDYDAAVHNILPEDIAVPSVDEYNRPNEALDAIMNSYHYEDKNGMPLTQGGDGNYYDQNGKQYKGEVSAVYDYTPEDILNLFIRNGYWDDGVIAKDYGEGFRGIDNVPQEVIDNLLATSHNAAENEREKFTGTEDEYYRLADLFIANVPALKILLDKGAIQPADIEKFFFRSPNGKKSPKGSGYGSTRSYRGGGGGGGYRGGGGGYSGGGSSPTTAKQKQSRIYNIMKNWSF